MIEMTDEVFPSKIPGEDEIAYINRLSLLHAERGYISSSNLIPVIHVNGRYATRDGTQEFENLTHAWQKLVLERYDEFADKDQQVAALRLFTPYNGPVSINADIGFIKFYVRFLDQKIHSYFQVVCDESRNYRIA